MKVLKSYPLYLVLGAIVLISSCAKQIAADRPDYVAAIDTYQPKPSSINLPIQLYLHTLEETINKELSGVLYEDMSYTNNNEDDLKIKVSKASEIKLSSKNGAISYSVPLSIWAKVRKMALGVELSKAVSLTTTLHFETKISLDKNWKLKTKTTSTGYEISEQPKIRLGPFKISINYVVEKALDKYLQDAAAALDNGVQENFNTRTMMYDAWKELQKPILIDENFSTWLLLKPVQFLMSPIKTDPEKIWFNVGIESFIQITSGDKPPYKIDFTLPDIKRTSAVNDTFKMALATEISFEQATGMLRENLVGFEVDYQKGKKKIVVQDGEVFGVGNKIGLRISLSGNVKGDVYLTGIPKYDSTTTELYVDEFNFDVKSRKAILKVADWMLHGAFQKKMAKLMRISLKEQVADASKTLQTSLDENPISESVYLKCAINVVRPEGIYVTESGLKTMLEVIGRASIDYGKKLDGE